MDHATITTRVVAVKVRPFGLYADLVNEGFASGHVVQCSQCDCSYRMFYKPGATIMEQSLLFQPFEDAVERAHGAGHPDDMIGDIS